jgi:hypothetical protein
MAVPPQPIEPERDQDGPDDDPERGEWHDQLCRGGNGQHHADGSTVTEHDWRKRAPHASRTPLLHPECNREEPTHPGIDPVVCTEQCDAG